jgi:hypothetical protein
VQHRTGLALVVLGRLGDALDDVRAVLTLIVFEEQRVAIGFVGLLFPVENYLLRTQR